MASRFRVVLLVASSLAGVAGLAGCNNFLAKNNPCGGIYPADGVAEIFGATIVGDMETNSGMSTFDSSVMDDSVGACETFASGTAADDGSGTTQVIVSCHDVDVTFTLPDVRALAEGATVSVPASVGAGGIGNVVPCRSAQASLSIVRAAGSKAASPAFVTSDFLRSVTLQVASDDASAAGDASASTCTPHVVVHARVELTAKSYKQATTSGEDHCPSLPSK